MQSCFAGFDFAFYSLTSLDSDNLGSAFVGFGVLSWRLSLVFCFFACLFFFFFSFFDCSGDAEKGGSEIVCLGGLTMDKREITHLFPPAFVLARASVSFVGAGSLFFVICRGAKTT